MTGYGANVEPVLKILQHCRIFIDHGNVIRFIRQVGRNGTANLAGSQDNDFHTEKPDAALSVNPVIPGREFHSAPFL
jgi:hypothetical protein